MPPFGYRKRERSASPSHTPNAHSRTTTKKTPTKPTLFQTVDEPVKGQSSAIDNKKYLDALDNDEDPESSLSEADSDDFEDVPPAKKRKVDAPATRQLSEDEEEDEIDWEDAIRPGGASTDSVQSLAQRDHEIADVSISMTEDGSYIEPLVSAATIKKGPSKREREIRIQTHCLHVQSLMWHNTVRNSWLNDSEVQNTLVRGMPEGVRREVERWKGAMGMPTKEELSVRDKKDARGKQRAGKSAKSKHNASGRDWSHGAAYAESGKVNLSGGDPLLRLLKVLTGYWRKRFMVTSPGLRKQGYKPLRRLRDEIKAWDKDRKDAEECGERVEGLAEFRKLAQRCEGSRDIGAQLFVALLRGIGLETRMVANLQPAGFGWSKAEEAVAKRLKTTKEEPKETGTAAKESTTGGVNSSGPIKADVRPQDKALKTQVDTQRCQGKTVTRRTGQKADPINLDESDSPLSSAPSNLEEEQLSSEDDDDVSVVDITPSLPQRKISRKFDRDLAFPIYWAEVCSPVSHKYYPVDPMVLSTIASNDELLQTFEPRGKKAEISKQVICYTIGFSDDGSAKDVTVRYLKKHQLPGKTKGMRIPVEKIPIYDKRGKVKRYEDYNWFWTLMSLHDRPENKRTMADDLEEKTDLKPFKATKETKEVEKESLQWYKQSAEFVLEQHLRREEALRPDAKPVRTFTAGKGDSSKEHPVYLRSDVVVCKTVESWHKEGRAILVGEQPLKYVPMRAVTLVRKREMEDAQRETGEKLKQGLYSVDQTEWIIPPPIENGVIPKNAFGNMDVYVPTMVPQGAVHLPLKGSAKLCKKLGIDFAEACTGFEFGKQRAVPVLTGVVVAEENKNLVRDAWRADQKELKRKEDTKRTAAALRWWRKMLLGLRVLQRMRTEYAEGDGIEEEINPFVAKAQREGRLEDMNVTDGNQDQEGGGFFLPGQEGDSPKSVGDKAADDSDDMDTTHSGALVVEQDGDQVEGGGFIVEEEPGEVNKDAPLSHAPITPVSLQGMLKDLNNASDSIEENPLNAAGHRTGRSKQKGIRRRKESTNTRKALNAARAEGSLSPRSSSMGHEITTPGSDHEKTISSRHKTNESSSRRLRGGRVTGRGAVAKQKATPTRSRYFDESSDNDDLSSEPESDHEVIRPRRTTARTRSRK